MQVITGAFSLKAKGQKLPIQSNITRTGLAHLNFPISETQLYVLKLSNVLLISHQQLLFLQHSSHTKGLWAENQNYYPMETVPNLASIRAEKEKLVLFRTWRGATDAVCVLLIGQGGQSKKWLTLSWTFTCTHDLWRLFNLHRNQKAERTKPRPKLSKNEMFC